jgi:hypothetical protein
VTLVDFREDEWLERIWGCVNERMTTVICSTRRLNVIIERQIPNGRRVPTPTHEAHLESAQINKMSVAFANSTDGRECKGYDPTDPANSNQNIYVQLVLSLALGLSAFFGFCVSLQQILITIADSDCHSSYVRDGKVYMPRGRGRAMKPFHSLSFLTRSLDGSQYYIRSQNNKSWIPQVSMHML